MGMDMERTSAAIDDFLGHALVKGRGREEKRTRSPGEQCEARGKSVNTSQSLCSLRSTDYPQREHCSCEPS